MKSQLTRLPRGLQAELVEKARVDVLINLTRKLAELEPTADNLDAIADDVIASLDGWTYFNRWINDTDVYNPSWEDVQWVSPFSYFLKELTNNTYPVDSEAYKTVDSRLREINKAICDIVDTYGVDCPIRCRSNNRDQEESWWWRSPWNDPDEHSRQLNLGELFDSLDDLEDLGSARADEGSYLSQEWRKLEDELRCKAGIHAPTEPEPSSSAPPANTKPTKAEVFEAVAKCYKDNIKNGLLRPEAVKKAIADNIDDVRALDLWRTNKGRPNEGDPGSSWQACYQALYSKGRINRQK